MITTDEVIQFWKLSGGSFHGPITETATIPLSGFSNFVKSVIGKTLIESQDCGALLQLLNKVKMLEAELESIRSPKVH